MGPFSVKLERKKGNKKRTETFRQIQITFKTTVSCRMPAFCSFSDFKPCRLTSCKKIVVRNRHVTRFALNEVKTFPMHDIFKPDNRKMESS